MTGIARALAVAAAGGALAEAAGVPAGWLSGSALATALAALAGLDVRLPRHLRSAAFVVLGTGMGAAVTPEAFAGIGEWPLALLALALTVAAVVAASFAILRRVGGFDPQTAACAAIPGALSHVLATAVDVGATLPHVALAQSLRLLVMVVGLPPLLTALGGGARDATSLPAVAGLPEAAAMLAIAGGFGILVVRLRMPAGLLLGAFVASAALHGFGLFETRLPDPVLAPAFVVLGAAIGVSFAGRRAGELKQAATAGLAALAAGLAISLASALLFARAFDAPFPEIALAFAPGGIEAMITLAFLLGYDVPFVAALHLLRVVGLILALPLVLRLARRSA